MAQSIEPNIADLANGWLKSYNLKDYPILIEYKGDKNSLVKFTH